MIETPTNTGKTEIFHNARIQHGPLSNRIYLMKINKADPIQLIPAMDELAKSKGYSKIFAKIPACHAESFLQSGYQKEAEVPGFYYCQEAALFLGKYLDCERQKEESMDEIQKVLNLAQSKKVKYTELAFLPADTVIRRCIPDDAENMSKLYKEVFLSYPFPIDNPRYIVDTMKDNLIYFGIEIDGRLASLASAEMNPISSNVEMTDFATLPAFRGNSFANQLLGRMENEMIEKGIQTAYTIARAISPAMNITFSKAGYTYGGRLINNTNIAGRIESMNVWYKKL
jgi:putative beta-lysine N-acetyltransferase